MDGIELYKPIFIVIFHFVIGFLGAGFARDRGKNSLKWFIFCFVFPPSIIFINWLSCKKNTSFKNSNTTENNLKNRIIILSERIWSNKIIKKYIWILYIVIFTIVPVILFFLLFNI